MSEELESNEKCDDEYEARSGQRHYVICKQPGPQWMAGIRAPEEVEQFAAWLRSKGVGSR